MGFNSGFKGLNIGVSIRLGYCTAAQGDCCPTFRDGVV